MSLNPAKLVLLLAVVFAISEVQLGYSTIDDESQGIFDSISDPLLTWCFHSNPIDDVGKQRQEDACKRLIGIYEEYLEEALTRKEEELPFSPIQQIQTPVVSIKKMELQEEATKISHEELVESCYSAAQLDYDGVEIQKILCQLISEVKFNASKEHDDDSAKLMDWCFDRPDDESGIQRQAGACKKIIQFVVTTLLAEQEKEDKTDRDQYVIKDIATLESLAVEGEEITLESVEVEREDTGEEITDQHFVSYGKELQESKAHLTTKLRRLNQDLQNSGLELANQVKSHLTDLARLKKNLCAELEQLKTDYQNLITAVQQQQDNFIASLRKLELSHLSQDLNDIEKSAD